MILPKTINNYTLFEKLGTGRYGTCYKAYDCHGNKVVLKKFKSKKHNKNIYTHENEAVILSVMDFPAIPRLLGIINHPSGYFFVMEYKDGFSLNEWLFHKHYQYKKEDIYRIGLQILDILIYMHSQNIIHGDLSISNILDTGVRVSVVDFGLSGYASNNGHAFQLDYACFANVLLYLLYSDAKVTSTIPWYEALPLNKFQKHYLLKLFAVNDCFADTQTVKQEFIRYFG